MGRPIKLAKNRKAMVQAMQDKSGYLYCQRCYTSNTFKFEVHHIVFRSEAPSHPNLHEPINLIILCKPCHDALHTHKYLRNPIVKTRELNTVFERNLIIEK